MNLKSKNEILSATNRTYYKYLKTLRKEIFDLKVELSLREAKIVELNAIIAGMSHKKGSHNSSMPPSSDIGRKPISLREKSDKKTGGQKGHEGTTLKFSATPHDVLKHVSSNCPVKKVDCRASFYSWSECFFYRLQGYFPMFTDIFAIDPLIT